MNSAYKSEKDWSTEEVLQAVNEELSSYVEDLEQRNRELQLLRGLGTLLQSCLTAEESHAVIARTVPKLFLTDSGAVYLFNSRLQTLEPVVAWGDRAVTDSFSPSSTGWSLVREQSYSCDGRCFPVLCPGGKQKGREKEICALIVGQHETLGVLYVQFNREQPERNGNDRQSASKDKRQLAVTTAETIALFLTNVSLRETLYNQTIHDPLTGLLNRRLLFELLEKELLRTARKKKPLGIIMIDIDHFKALNDTCGHGAGDAVLRGFGMFFQNKIRGWDFACRYGGDEFLLVLTETSLENAKLRAEQFCQEAKLLRVHYRGGLLDPMTLSLGVAVYPEHGQTAQELLFAADAALYQAKADGRDRSVTVRKHTLAAYAQQLERGEQYS